MGILRPCDQDEMPIVTNRTIYRHFTGIGGIIKVNRPRRLATRLWKFLMYGSDGTYLGTCLNTEIRKDADIIKKLHRTSSQKR